MGKNVCIKEWVNGYELSVAIDNNMNAGFRAHIVLFEQDRVMHSEIIWETCMFTITHMAVAILEAKEFANKKEVGPIDSFPPRIYNLVNH